MITKRLGRPGKVWVTFTLPAAIWADTIFLVGDFNSWDKCATPLRQMETGWMVTLELDAGCAFQYRYLLNDHEWHNDWNADSYAPNSFGGDNSVVETPEFVWDTREVHGAYERERVLNFVHPRLQLVQTG